MAAHGRFHNKYPYYPLMIGYFKHPSMKYPRTVEFVIDTGADRTFISPIWRYLLQVPPRNFKEYPNRMITIGGHVNVDCLDNCSLSFNRYDNSGHLCGAYELTGLRILFSKTTNGSHFKEEGKIPSLLGRDVLSTMSLGYCQKSQYLFLTQEYQRYYGALNLHFPKP